MKNHVTNEDFKYTYSFGFSNFLLVHNIREVWTPGPWHWISQMKIFEDTPGPWHWISQMKIFEDTDSGKFWGCWHLRNRRHPKAGPLAWHELLSQCMASSSWFIRQSHSTSSKAVIATAPKFSKVSRLYYLLSESAHPTYTHPWLASPYSLHYIWSHE